VITSGSCIFHLRPVTGEAGRSAHAAIRRSGRAQSAARGGGSSAPSRASQVPAPWPPDPRMPRSAAGKQRGRRATAAPAGEFPQTWPAAAGGTRRRSAAAQPDPGPARPEPHHPTIAARGAASPGISHLPQSGRQIRGDGLHPGPPRDRQASVDEDVTPDLIDDLPRRCQERPRTAMTDEDHRPAGRAAGYHARQAQAVRRPCRDRASKVRDAYLVASAGQVSRDQIPGCATHQRAMNEQQPTSHGQFVSPHAGHAGVPADRWHNP